MLFSLNVSKRNDRRRKEKRERERRGKEGKETEERKNPSPPLIYSGVEVYGIANLQRIGTDTRAAGSYSP